MTHTTDRTFLEDVLEGLQAQPKRLSSRYFYDEKGDRLFQQIMHMEEYYLTNCEYEIMDMHKQAMLEQFGAGGQTFDLVEFGAGDGLKTKVLLRHFLDQKADFHYAPVDISANVLEILADTLRQSMPELSIQLLNHEYFQALAQLKKLDNYRKVILFMGGNIGNFLPGDAVSFLARLRQELSPGDLVMIGFDLKKDPRVIRTAYDDPAGITRAFNVNLLHRINRELNADFDPAAFSHYETYHPSTGRAESFLISRKAQQVRIGIGQTTFSFAQWEPIHVEVSQKYDLQMIDQMTKDAGFQHVAHYFDCKHWFVDTLWRVG